MVRATFFVRAADFAGEADDEIHLDFDHRHRRRLTLVSGSGREFLLDLRSATALADGDALVLDDDSVVIVRASAERVVDVSADSPEHLARIAWHLGNRHLATEIRGDTLRILEDHVIVEMLEGLHATLEHKEAPFQPEGGAYAHEH